MSTKEENFSEPFQISRYDKKGNGSENISIKFEFEDKKPVKLGDGSFGAVYLGRKVTDEEPVAIKLLYDKNTMKPRQLRELSSAEKKWLIDEKLNAEFQTLGQELQLEEVELKNLIMDHNESDFALLRKLEAKCNSKKNGSDTLSNLISFLDQLTTMASSSAVYRFQSERTVTGRLMDSYELQHDGERKTPGLVKVWGGTAGFKSILNQSLQEINEYFKADKSIKFSDYVLVMDYYDYSLKDLLERPFNKIGRLKEGKQPATRREDVRNGYDLLRNSSHDLRVREALLILENVATGLIQLHNRVDKTGHKPFFHLDVKSGNIFIKASDDKFETALGDLGNLPRLSDSKAEIPPDGGSLTTPPGYDDAPGTHHYRSPEQKYHMDVANVEVKHVDKVGLKEKVNEILGIKRETSHNQSQEPSLTASDQPASNPQPLPDSSHTNGKSQTNSSEEKAVVLIVKDPKFKNTLIEKNDYIILSKDADRKRHYIDPEPISNDDTGQFAFVLRNSTKDLLLSEEANTQVEFYKQQNYRTDLFGIGAVAFDIITAGRSPEKFYESIRKYEEKSIEDIRTRYETLIKGKIESLDLDLAQIFEPFRNEIGEPFPEKDIVEFILKCMLYQSKGTFYKAHEQEPWKASKQLEEEIKSLLGTYKLKSNSYFSKTDMDKSLLIHRPKVEENIVPSIQFDKEIDRLQGIESWPDDHPSELKELGREPELQAANRLLYGAYYFSLVIEHISLNIWTNISELSQILPSLMSLKLPPKGGSGRAALDLVGPRSLKLAEDARNNKLEYLIRSPTNPFVPNGIAGIRREIRLSLSSKSNNEEPSNRANPPENDSIECEYRFRDASLFYQEISCHDWIVWNGHLWTVAPVVKNEKVVKNKITIKPVKPEKDAEFDEALVVGEINKALGKGHIEGAYFSALDPFKYYLDMLGLYLQHLIFVYSPLTTTSRKRIDINALLRSLEIDPKKIIIRSPAPEFIEKNNTELHRVHTNYLYLLLMLTLHESEDSYYSWYRRLTSPKESDPIEIGKKVLDHVDKYAQYQYEQILKVLLKKTDNPKYYPSPMTPNDPQFANFKKSYEQLVGKFDIEKTIRESGMIAWSELSRHKPDPSNQGETVAQRHGLNHEQ